MEQNPSWEANPFLASQETLRILWIPEVHHHIPFQAPAICSYLKPR
jgi:hypothetical protein